MSGLKNSATGESTVSGPKRKRSQELSVDDYGDDVLTVLRQQWVSRGRQDLDFEEFISGLAIVHQFIEREGHRNLKSMFNMSVAELRILLVLDRIKIEGGLRPTDLFRHLLISSGAVTKQLDRLETRGLIRRLPDPRNTRGFRIELTQEGQDVVTSIVSGNDRILPSMEDIFNRLSKGNRNKLLQLLHILTQGVREANRLTPFD